MNDKRLVLTPIQFNWGLKARIGGFCCCIRQSPELS